MKLHRAAHLVHRTQSDIVRVAQHRSEILAREVAEWLWILFQEVRKNLLDDGWGNQDQDGSCGSARELENLVQMRRGHS